MQRSASEDSEPGFPPTEDAPTAWLDVRSPSEYAAGHVPGAYSLPLLSDSERHQVGLCFKNRGSAEAVDLAWLYVGPKIPWLLQTLRVLSEKAGIGANRSWMVYCWRGGQRSMGMELLVRQSGYPVQRYAGGYKAWRGRMTRYGDNPGVGLSWVDGPVRPKPRHSMIWPLPDNRFGFGGPGRPQRFSLW